MFEPGDIMVIAPLSPSDAGYFGDILATSAQAHRGAGVVVDGGVRDVAVLEEMRFPIWSTAVCARGTVKETLGSANHPIVCAGVSVTPVDVIVANRDGDMAVPRETAAATLAKALSRIASEEEKREALAWVELSLDLRGLRQVPAAKGVR